MNLFLILGVLTGAAQAAEIKLPCAMGQVFVNHTGCVDLMEGGEVPVPYGLTNQKVELADGEIYTLRGRVVNISGDSYFEVDLASHPWLSGGLRQAHPFYRIRKSELTVVHFLQDKMDPNWTCAQYEGKRVEVTVKASSVVNLVDHAYSIELEVLFKPSPMAVQGEFSF